MSKNNVKRVQQQPLAAGQMLGRYELLMPIGAGGMGNVWAARLKGTRGFRKLVAVKTILHTFEDPRLEQMLFQEATLASQIHHPNVVETLELGDHEGTMYLAMELIDGESLSCIMREAFPKGGIPLAISVNLIGQVCKGLQAAHDLCDDDGQRVGLVHRDISPPNILVTYSGTVKIVDFGVATTNAAPSESDEIKGKISYLAPEQLRSEPLDGRVDVFTTGVLLYLLTVGRHPFKAQTEAQTVSRIIGEKPAVPPSMLMDDYPEELERVLLRALEKDRDRRWQSAAEFLQALHHALPEAFAPNFESGVAEYLKELLHARMVERRDTLRLAEELAEKSCPPRDSNLSLPAVVTLSGPLPVVAPRRKSKVAVVGALVAMSAAAGVAWQLAPKLSKSEAALETPQANAAITRVGDADRAASAGSSTLAGAASTGAATGTSAGATALPLGGSQPDAASGGSAAVAALATAAARAPSRSERGSGRPDASTQDAEDSEEVAAPDWDASSPELALSASAEPLPPAEPTSALTASAVPPPPGTVAPPQPSATATARTPSGPRMLSSKMGHGRLSIDPMASAYRVKLPAALERLGQTFTATVRICVAPSGRVSSVDVLRSAGPALDPQIPAVLSRWRYKPLIENGQAVPFCYMMQYQIAGR